MPGPGSTSKLPVTAVRLLNDDVLPTFEARDARIEAVQSGNGREFCGRPDQHPYELFLELEDIEHRTTRVKRPQSNGIVERFHRTLLDEHSRVEGRRMVRDHRRNAGRSRRLSRRLQYQAPTPGTRHERQDAHRPLQCWGAKTHPTEKGEITATENSQPARSPNPVRERQLSGDYCSCTYWNGSLGDYFISFIGSPVLSEPSVFIRANADRMFSGNSDSDNFFCSSELCRNPTMSANS